MDRIANAIRMNWYQHCVITWNGLFRFSIRAQANKICAPYGRIPWKAQAKMSRREAVRFGSTPYSLLISFAIVLSIRIATVLLAVAMLVREVMTAMPSSAVWRFLITLLIFWRSHSKPPSFSTILARPPVIIDNRKISNIPEKPL